MLFVFGTLVEFSLVLFLYQTHSGEDNAISLDGFKMEPGQTRKIYPEEGNSKKMKQLEMKTNSQRLMDMRSNSKSPIADSKKKEFLRLRLMKKIDFICFFAFNFGYFVFNVIYWATYIK